MGRGTLRQLRVHEGSLVDDPANPHAKIVLTKRAPGAQGDGKMRKDLGQAGGGTPSVPNSPEGENPTNPATPDKNAPPAPGAAGAADPLAGLSDQQKQAVAQMLQSQKAAYEAKIAALSGGAPAPAPAPAAPAPAAPAPAAPAAQPHMPAKNGGSDGDGNGDEEGSYEKALEKALGGHMPESVRKALERDREERIELKKRLDGAEEQVRVEKEARLSREYLEKARSRDYAGLPGTAQEIAKQLRAVDALPQEMAKGLHSTLKLAAARARAGEEVLGKSFGVGPGGTAAQGGDDPWSKIVKNAREMVEKSAGKLTEDGAISKYLESDEGKALYQEYQEERQARIGRPTA
jgi:hypothetical protein